VEIAASLFPSAFARASAKLIDGQVRRHSQGTGGRNTGGITSNGRSVYSLDVPGARVAAARDAAVTNGMANIPQ